MTRTRTRTRELVLRYALLLFVLVICVGPFVWQLSTALKSPSEDIYTEVPQLLPAQPTMANFQQVGQVVPVFGYIANSLTVAALVVGGNVIGATCAGYALAKLRFRGRRIVMGVFLSTLILPAEATIISQFVTVKSLGLADTLLGVALPGMISVLNVLIMYNAFRGIPDSLDEAAIIDGATVWQRLRHIGLPGVRGSLAIVVIFAFVGAWDDFLWPLIVLTTPDHFTLTVGLQYLSSTFANDQRLKAAGAMISFLPVAVVFIASQRWFFRGVGEGAVKG